MDNKKIAIFITATVVMVLMLFVGYKFIVQKSKKLPYKTENPQRRTIKQIIETTGKIRVTEKIKIGSLVTGIVKNLYVDENQLVKKGQLLAEIDTGKDDTDLRQEEGNLQKAKAQYKYQKSYFERQKVLYESGQIAKDAFEQVERDYLSYKGEFFTAQAKRDKAKQDFDNRKFFAPEDGIIIKIGVSEGERVTTDLKATVLFEIAKDVTKMEAVLEIDEGNIGNIKQGQKVKFTVDSFPHKMFKTTINQIGYSPKEQNGNLYYKAIIPADNSEKILRPGMSVDAKINVAKAKNVLAITSQAFMISSKVLEEIAKDLKFSFHKVEERELKKLRKEGKPVETVWVVQKNGVANSFVERMVTINLTDDIFFEITSGLSETDDVIVDIEESSYLEEMLKKAYGNKF